MTYHPDTWVLLQIRNEDEVHFRILAGWYGGYLGGDSWKASSGVEKVEDKGDSYEVTNASGSVYICPKSVERLSGYTASILNSFQKENTDTKYIDTITMEEYLNEETSSLSSNSHP